MTTQMSLLPAIPMLIVGTAYLALIAVLTAGWFRLPRYRGGTGPFTTSASIIIPVRNEENNIGNILEDLDHQAYPRGLMEVVLADDHSEDNTLARAREFMEAHPLLPVTLLEAVKEDPRQAGKKKTLARAVAASRGELVLTLDADCRAGSLWLSTLVSFYEAYRPKMISGPVVFQEEKNVFSKLQSLEFLSLVGSGAGSVSAGFPLMCNGANLAFVKEAFLLSGGYCRGDAFASGDDIFLMLNIRKHYGPHAVHFCRSMDSAVLTAPAADFRSFWQQRLRWVSKSRGYSGAGLIFSALTVYLFNLTILVSTVGAVFIPGLRIYAAGLFLLKLAADFPLLASIGLFAGKSRLLAWYLPVQLLYPFYVTVFGFMGNLLPVIWKGRMTGK